MIRLHIDLDDALIRQTSADHCPRIGETIRFASGAATVREVIWRFDEPHFYPRVDVRCEVQK